MLWLGVVLQAAHFSNVQPVFVGSAVSPSTFLREQWQLGGGGGGEGLTLQP
jgi:hypothetical protein